MRVLEVRNVHEALPRAIQTLHRSGVVRSSRNGNVVRLIGPVSTVYGRPTERVEFHEWRDSNPFFHFYESLWMLAGRNDIRPLTKYVKRMTEYSDDGKTQNAAYGHRWRHALMSPYDTDGDDQLIFICDALKKSHDSRQQVLQIWDHRLDLGTDTKDHACNIAATFQIFEGHLDMVVFCRSNDVIWGAYGSNAVHFSMLLEYMARRIGVEIGSYTQISVNWHAYSGVYTKMVGHALTTNHYQNPYDKVRPFPIADENTDFDKWDDDCRRFITEDGRLPKDSTHWEPFFWKVAIPIVGAHDLYQDGDITGALRVIESCWAEDWRLACSNWLKRRDQKSSI